MSDNKNRDIGNEFFDDQVLDDFSSLNFDGETEEKIGGIETDTDTDNNSIPLSDEPPIGYSEPIEEEIAEDNKQEARGKSKNKQTKEKKSKDKKKTAATSNSIEKENQQQTTQEKEKFILYILTDKPKNGLLTYIRECGVNVSHIYSSIDETRDAIIMQSEPYRLVIIDNGTGKFTSTTTRQQLIDIIGLCDESTRITVFYTDSALKIDTVASLYGKSKKGIDWVKYKSTINVAAKLLTYTSEEYIDDEDTDSEVFSDDYEVMSFKGLTIPKKIQEADKIIIQGFDTSSLEKELLSEETESIQQFKIKLKV